MGLKRYHHFRGELEAAIGTAQTWLDEDGRSAPAAPIEGILFEDILLYLDAGRVGDAAGLLEQLDASDPRARDNLVTRARIHLALESRGVEAAFEAHERAVEAAEAGGYVEPPMLLTADLGMIQERAGDYAAAADSYHAALDLLADSSPLAWRAQRVNIHLGAGRALRKAGRFDQSEAELRQVLFHIPAHPHAHLELALVLDAKGDTPGAIEHLRTALAAWENADESYEPAQEARSKLAELTG